MKNLLIYITSSIDISPLPQVRADNPDSVKNILFILFSVLGGVALIVMVLSGIKFVLSQGNPDEVNKARNSIIYSAIGLVIAISAATIVNFVLGKL